MSRPTSYPPYRQLRFSLEPIVRADAALPLDDPASIPSPKEPGDPPPPLPEPSPRDAVA